MAQNNLRTGVATNSISFPQPSSPTTHSASPMTTTTSSPPSSVQPIPLNPTPSAASPSSASQANNARLRLVPYTPPMGSIVSGPSQTPSLRFAPVERSIPPNVIVKVGRYTDRHTREGPRHVEGEVEPIRFKSKVVSRLHAEVWYERGELYIRDTASSSGTFLNQARLSPQNVRSSAVRVRDGDCLQLGVEYRGGEQEIFRCVRMRVELNRRHADNSTYRNAALAAVISPLQHATLGRSVSGSPGGLGNDTTLMPGGVGHPMVTSSNSTSMAPSSSAAGGNGLTGGSASQGLADCCICLLPLRRSTLLVTPCAHCYHFACIRPLLLMRTRAGATEEADGFTCPICRAYVDLMAEPEELSEDELAEMAALAAAQAQAETTTSTPSTVEVTSAPLPVNAPPSSLGDSTAPNQDQSSIPSSTQDGGSEASFTAPPRDQERTQVGATGNTALSSSSPALEVPRQTHHDEHEWEADPRRAPSSRSPSQPSEEIDELTQQAQGLHISSGENRDPEATGSPGATSSPGHLPSSREREEEEEEEEDGDITTHPDTTRREADEGGEERMIGRVDGGGGGEMGSAMTPPSTGGLFPSTFLSAPSHPMSTTTSADSTTSYTSTPLDHPPQAVGSSSSSPQRPPSHPPHEEEEGTEGRRNTGSTDGGEDEEEGSRAGQGGSRRLDKVTPRDEA